MSNENDCMFLLKHLFICLFLCILTASLIQTMKGQNNSSTNNTQAVAEKPNESETKPSLQEHQESSEAKVLRAQLETMKDYNERILDTIYWALGGMIAVILVTAFLGWYSNFRVYKKDLDSMRAELKALLSEEALRNRTELENELNKKYNNSFEKLNKSIDTKLEGQSSLFNETNKAWDKLWEINQIQVSELVAKRWENEKVYINAVTSNLSKLESAHKIGWKNSATEALREMKRLLELRVEEINTRKTKPFGIDLVKNQAIDQETSERIVKVLDSLSPEYNHLSEDIYRLLGVSKMRTSGSLLSSILPPTKPL